MADNQDQHRQSAHWTQNVVATMLGKLTGSESERKPPNDNFQHNYRVPDQAVPTQTSNQHVDRPTDSVFARGSARVEASQVHKGYPEDRSQDSEHASSIYTLQTPVEMRHPSALRDTERSERRSATKANEMAIQQRDDEILALHTQMQELEKRSSRYEGRYRSAKRERDEALDRVSHLEELLEDAQRQGERGACELGKLKELLDHRTEEVKVAQAFMTTADRYSVAEICQMVEQLNDEIYQCSMDLSDAMIGRNIVPKDSILDEGAKARLEEAREFFNLRWNKAVVPQLASHMGKGDPDTTLFDCLIQYALLTWAHNTIRNFCSRNNEVERYLAKLWEEVAATHETSIARNWLAITSGTLKSQGQLPDGAVITKWLGYLMTVSGREALPADRLEEVIGGKINKIGQGALKVKEAIAEGIFSIDIEVLTCGMSVGFDSTSMRDAFENPGQGRRREGTEDGGLAICPTGLGLCRVIRERSKSDPSCIRRKNEILLKVKVLLLSTLKG